MTDGEENDKDVMAKKMTEVLATLTPREAKVLKERFGIDGTEPSSLKNAFPTDEDLSDRIRKIEQKAMKKLRNSEEYGKPRCSFCGKSEVRVKSLAKSDSDAAICNECLVICDEIIRNEDE